MPHAGGSSELWHVVHALAGRQRGLVMREQLVAAGLTRSAITHRVRSGHLHRIHRGVYAVGQPTLAPLGRLLAAIMPAGPGSVLSHVTAAVLWGLLRDLGGPIHVTTTQRHRRAPDGVILHRTHLHGHEVEPSGRPTTSSPRSTPTPTTRLAPHSKPTATDDATHTAHGYRTLRITWRRLTQHPEAVAAQLAQALALTPGEPTPRRG